MTVSLQPSTVMAALRQLPYLEPEDSLYRAVDLLRHAGVDSLPVIDARGRIAGMVGLPDLKPLLDGGGADPAMHAPVSTVLRAPGAVGRVGMSLEEAAAALRGSPDAVLPVAGVDGRYLGAVTVADLLAPHSTPPRPASVGGMATPWGVYLTGAGLQAGAGSVPLIASGVVLGLLLVASHVLSGVGLWLAQRALGYPLYALWNAPQPATLSLSTAGWYALQALSAPVFVLLLRLTPLTGYHAAEHQAVHAMERGEPLTPAVVARMPRVHPRCGTNLMAAGMVFTSVSQLVVALAPRAIDPADGAVLGAIAAFFTWRSVGAFLQQYFTTRPATQRQLEAGIAAAEELQAAFLREGPRRMNLLRRIWCMGMPQMAIGVSVGFLAGYAEPWLFSLLR